MIKGTAHISLQDEDLVFYEYSGWTDCPNLDPWQKDEDCYLYDGIFIIYKKGLEEPEIHSKLKKKANGRKVVVEKKDFSLCGCV